ncbi:MAG: GNAT family N-acetyltransferase [Oscillospiraceae bacterium]
MYQLVTNRMYMTLSNPRLASQVAAFNLRNKDILADTEPVRPDIFYTKNGQRKLLRLDYKDAMRGEEFRYYLTLKGSKNIIGTVCLSSILFGSVKSCFLSYKIDGDYRNQGLCSEAVEEIINFAFKTLQLHRIEVYVMPKNSKSLKIMDKFHFSQEGLSKQCLEVNGRWEDHYRYALLNPDKSLFE